MRMTTLWCGVMRCDVIHCEYERHSTTGGVTPDSAPQLAIMSASKSIHDQAFECAEGALVRLS